MCTKNVLRALMRCFVLTALVTVLWLVDLRSDELGEQQVLDLSDHGELGYSL